ncbi:aminotransferase class I/II-fold pyridoxal phosphate-dependent enzyme [uncultured Aquimarina sp.]|uniref:pyridoxal phosphate-dependent aminotransferase n=1 Tax=uncultured Aquimarina sp. TaxID=575652 RepID=UPI002615F4FF|nr:aminotransferase class I/II-fold pyridoxal phosphate-dependent enzyme [uncultured Aquimarina sp.]
MLKGHGDDLYRYNSQIDYNFSSNVYYKGCKKLLLEAISNAIQTIENYPSPIARELNVLAADKFNLNSNQFLFTNGAVEAFYLIAQLYKNKRATITSPTFSEYEDACKINQLECCFADREAIEFTNFDSELVFICNPNNPDGKILELDKIQRLLSTHPQTHFIIDEAYIEFSNQVETAVPLINLYTNLTIVRSLTKTFAIPGLRLGYIISNSNFIKEVLTYKMPWSVNSLAIKGGQFIFENYEKLAFDAEALFNETEQFKQQLKKIEWLEIIPGTTSYFLVKLKNRKASSLKNYLIEKHQILIRDATNFTGLQGEYIRLAVQSQTANNKLIKALKEWN